MALETGTYISDLVAANPTSGDPVSQADDHIRLVKSTVKATVPNLTGAMNATHTELNRLVGSLGLVVDRAYAENTAATNLSTLIPLDDTIPQSTEGTQVVSVSITPKNTTNRLRVRFQCSAGSNNIAEVLIAAAFHNASTSAYAASFGTAAYTSSAVLNAVLEYEFVPASTSAQTIAIRVGGYVGTVRLNGNGTARLLGATSRATLVVDEIAV